MPKSKKTSKYSNAKKTQTLANGEQLCLLELPTDTSDSSMDSLSCRKNVKTTFKPIIQIIRSTRSASGNNGGRRHSSSHTEEKIERNKFPVKRKGKESPGTKKKRKIQNFTCGDGEKFFTGFLTCIRTRLELSVDEVMEITEILQQNFHAADPLYIASQEFCVTMQQSMQSVIKDGNVIYTCVDNIVENLKLHKATVLVKPVNNSVIKSVSIEKHAHASAIAPNTKVKKENHKSKNDKPKLEPTTKEDVIFHLKETFVKLNTKIEKLETHKPVTGLKNGDSLFLKEVQLRKKFIKICSLLCKTKDCKSSANVKEDSGTSSDRILDKASWSRINLWLCEAKVEDNKEFIIELLGLCTLLPMTLEWLKENSTPKVVKSFTKHENNDIKSLSTELVRKWMKLIDSNLTVSRKERKLSEESTSCLNDPKKVTEQGSVYVAKDVKKAKGTEMMAVVTKEEQIKTSKVRRTSSCRSDSTEMLSNVVAHRDTCETTDITVRLERKRPSTEEKAILQSKVEEPRFIEITTQHAGNQVEKENTKLEIKLERKRPSTDEERKRPSTEEKVIQSKIEEPRFIEIATQHAANIEVETNSASETPDNTKTTEDTSENFAAAEDIPSVYIQNALKFCKEIPGVSGSYTQVDTYSVREKPVQPPNKSSGSNRKGKSNYIRSLISQWVFEGINVKGKKSQRDEIKKNEGNVHVSVSQAVEKSSNEGKSPSPAKGMEMDKDVTKQGKVELKSMLIHERTTKEKKNVKWIEDSKLLEVFYFELDKSERENVYRQRRSFKDLKQNEMRDERRHCGRGRRPAFDNMVEEIPWWTVPILIDVPRPKPLLVRFDISPIKSAAAESTVREPEFIIRVPECTASELQTTAKVTDPPVKEPESAFKEPDFAVCGKQDVKENLHILPKELTEPNVEMELVDEVEESGSEEGGNSKSLATYDKASKVAGDQSLPLSISPSATKLPEGLGMSVPDTQDEAPGFMLIDSLQDLSDSDSVSSKSEMLYRLSPKKCSEFLRGNELNEDNGQSFVLIDSIRDSSDSESVSSKSAVSHALSPITNLDCINAAANEFNASGMATIEQSSNSVTDDRTAFPAVSPSAFKLPRNFPKSLPSIVIQNNSMHFVTSSLNTPPEPEELPKISPSARTLPKTWLQYRLTPVTHA